MSFIDTLSDAEEQLRQLQNQLLELQKILVIESDRIRLGYSNAHITVMKTGTIQVTGYSKKRKKYVTANIDDLINDD